MEELIANTTASSGRWDHLRPRYALLAAPPVLFGLGVLLVHGLGFDRTSLPVDPMGAARHYLLGGLVTVIMTVLVGVVVTGLALTAWRLAASLGRAARSLLASGWRRVAARLLAPACALGAGLAFAYSSGGSDAFVFWGLAIGWTLPVVMGIGLLLLCAFFPVAVVGHILASIASVFGRDVSEAVSVWSTRIITVGLGLVGLTTVAVPKAAEHASAAPAHLPFTAGGWGTYLAGWVGVSLITAGWVSGSRLGRRLCPPPTPPAPRSIELDQEEFWSPTPASGWRTWAWTPLGLHGYRVPWPDGELTAECLSCDEVPGWSHSCGIYAVKTRQQLSTAFFHQTGRVDLIAGRVEMEGLVIEHESGYRAERARIVELIVPDELADDVARRYPGVRVVAEQKNGGALWRT